MFILTQLAREWQWWSLYTVVLLFAFPYSLLLISQLIKKLRLILGFSNNYEGLSTNFPPGSTCLLPFIGETLQFVAAIYTKQGFYDFVQVRHMRFGKWFKTHIFGETYVFVSSTKAAKEILSNDLGKFTKRYIKSIGEVVGSESLLCASHQSHKLIRGRLLELFSSSSMLKFIKEFDQLVVNTLATWEHKKKVVILDEALEITLKAMCKMLLSVDDESQIDELQKDIGCVCKAMLAFPLKFPWTRFSKGLRARKRIMGLLEKMIIERREENLVETTSYFDKKDCLQYLLATNCKLSCPTDQASSLTDSQIKDNILTMIIAGQDTTASAITWMVKYLDENQGVREALRDEQKPFSFLAFGAGGRTCLGMNLARAMMLGFLYRLVTTYKWKVTDPDPSIEKWALFSRLKSGCPIEVIRV